MCQQGAQKDQMDIHKYELLLVIHVTHRDRGTHESLSKGPSENTEKHEGKVWANKQGNQLHTSMEVCSKTYLPSRKRNSMEE